MGTITQAVSLCYHKHKVTLYSLLNCSFRLIGDTCFLSPRKGIFHVNAAADFHNLPSSCTHPYLYSHMMFLPLTYNNLPSQDSLETHVIRVNETCWQLIFNCPAPAGISSVKAGSVGEFYGHLGASRVGLPSCSDILPRVSWWECESSIHMIY